MMATTNLKPQLLALAQQALEASTLSDSLLERGRGATATFHPDKDNELHRLESLGDAVLALREVPAVANIVETTEDVERVVLQFIYDYLERQTRTDFEEQAFEDTWTSFLEELKRPEWRYRSIAYLQNFTSDDPVLMLGDGVTIYHRGAYDFRAMGWSDFAVEKLHEDWHTERHLLFAEDRVPKARDNFILSGNGQPIIKMQRMLRALRLTKEGELVLGGGGGLVGQILSTRPAGSGFPPKSAASRSTFTSAWRPGPSFVLSAKEIPQVNILYNLLHRIEGQPTAGYNLSLALRFFESSYDRLPAQNDTRVVDLITTAEALVGTSIESSFRLAYRVAGILANSDEERVRIFTEMKSFYTARSKVVHGDATDKVQPQLDNYAALRVLIRRLVVGFLHLTAYPDPKFTKKYFTESGLDADLNSSVLRAAVRRSMGLEQAT
jgi:hypothetical protein